MSKFQSTISVIAALASIFGAASAGWKLAENNSPAQPVPVDTAHEDRIIELQRELEDFKQKTTGEDGVPSETPPDPSANVIVAKPAVPEPQVAPANIPPAPPAPNIRSEFE